MPLFLLLMSLLLSSACGAEDQSVDTVYTLADTNCAQIISSFSFKDNEDGTGTITILNYGTDTATDGQPQDCFAHWVHDDFYMINCEPFLHKNFYASIVPNSQEAANLTSRTGVRVRSGELLGEYSRDGSDVCHAAFNAN